MSQLAGKLSLCWGSMEGVALHPFLAAAAGAGFDAVTLNSVLVEDARAKGLGDADLRRLLDDHGLAVSGIDPLFNWLPGAVTLAGDDTMSRITQPTAEDIFAIAQAAGTDLVNAAMGLAVADSEQQIIDSFANLCQRAAAEGLRVSLEFMPFCQVADLDTALRIVDSAGQANGGIMLDCWHLHRSGGQPDDLLAVPGEKIIAMQLDDALAEPMTDIVEETLNHRLLPGEGCIDLARLLTNLDRIGAAVTYDVEVFKQPLRALPPAQRASAMYTAARSILDPT